MSAFKGTTVVGAEEIRCQNISEVFNCLHVGMSNRQVRRTTDQHQPNHTHSIFTLTLRQHWIVGMCATDIQHAFKYRVIHSVSSNSQIKFL
jgi:hypothetical protein